MYYPIQRYKFESNSQRKFTSKFPRLVVLSDTKIQIWKQFTTTKKRITHSKSCIIRYKDTNLKAIHNCPIGAKWMMRVVLSDTKIQIWKQFTTSLSLNTKKHRCIIRYKDTNLKAIHNTAMRTCWQLHVVLSDTKIQIWKQFTTATIAAFICPLLYYPIQRYKFESNSQHPAHGQSWHTGCIIRYKDTNLKAIHNSAMLMIVFKVVVLSDTKIQIWKQFTTSSYSWMLSVSCIIRYKDTNLKAIHNATIWLRITCCVVLSDTKIQIWKQFTTIICKECYDVGCIIRYKDTNLKAIHNSLHVVTIPRAVVLSDTKIQIWKQFTTVINC